MRDIGLEPSVSASYTGTRSAERETRVGRHRIPLSGPSGAGGPGWPQLGRATWRPRFARLPLHAGGGPAGPGSPWSAEGRAPFSQIQNSNLCLCRQ